MTSRLETSVSVLIALSAVAVATSVVYRTFFSAEGTALETSAATFVTDWQESLGEARWIGPADAKVRLLVFTDFQCPFCREFHRAFTQLPSSRAPDVALAYLDYPLPQHRSATAAAHAAGCADRQGRYREFTGALFDAQDSLESTSWVSLARRAGVPDTNAFVSCVQGSIDTLRLARSRAHGKRARVTGTPTVLVNGWRLAAPPSASGLDSLVARILAGGSVNDAP